MRIRNLSRKNRRGALRWGVVAFALLAISVLGAWFLEATIPRHIVMASGAQGGVYHRYAKRYKEMLAREGVTLEERMTAGAEENLKLLLDPKSGVDVAFMQGGLAPNPEDVDLVMLASLYYEPMWIFYSGSKTISRVEEFRGKRIAVGAPGSGTRQFALSVLSVNGVSPDNTTLSPAGGKDALNGLIKGDFDAAIFVGGAQTGFLHDALWNLDLKLMSFKLADAYVRRVPYITKLTLPEGTIDLAGDIPSHDITLIGTTAMLVAREDFPPALINLLLDVARDVHGGKGAFESAGEFPGITQVDFPVSPHAERHKRFGPSFLHRYFPFWIATFIERLIVIVLPLLVIVVPLINFLPQILRWRKRSRIYRWYGELALLERDVSARKGVLPIGNWLADLDRIERAAERLRVPASFASEAYTLREHIGLVRRAVMAKAQAASAAP